MRRFYLICIFALQAIVLSTIARNAFADSSENATPLETSSSFGEYTVFYNAFPSLTLPAAAAETYHIDRASDVAFINIAVRRQSHGSDTEQAVALKGTYTDLIRTDDLKFREIREQGSICYIAQIPIHNREFLRFDIQVQPQLKADEPAPIGSPFKISFTRKFYTDQ